MSMYTLVGKQTDFVLDAFCDWKPVEVTEDGCNVSVFGHPRQDPGGGVLHVLKLLEAFCWDPDEEGIAVVQPGGDKGMNQLLSIGGGEWDEVLRCFLDEKMRFYRDFVCGVQMTNVGQR